MSFRDDVARLGSTKREIPLATHRPTFINNETCEPDLVPTPTMSRNEAAMAARYVRRRPPIAGYNCFGMALAHRRTAITGLDGGRLDIQRILDEDGYAVVARGYEVAGDLVAYSDDRGVTHTARVDRIEKLKLGLDGATTRTIVLSKFNDISGEFEHLIDDTSWADPKWHEGRVTYRVFRDRSQAPRGPGWRASLITLQP